MYLQKLTKNYRLFLLSNTNNTHQKEFQKIIDTAVGWGRFKSVFDGIGYSYQQKSRKPNAEIFEKMLWKYELNPEETIFIDDTLEHTESAKKLGLHSVHLKNREEIWDVLKDL